MASATRNLPVAAPLPAPPVVPRSGSLRTTPPFDGPLPFRVQLGWEEWMAGQIRLLGRPWGSQEEPAPRLTAPRTRTRAEERPVPSRFSQIPLEGPLPRGAEREALPIDTAWHPLTVAMVVPPFALPLWRAALSYGPDPTPKKPVAPTPARAPEPSPQPVTPPVASAVDMAESVATFFVIPPEAIPTEAIPAGPPSPVVTSSPVQVNWPATATEPEPSPAPVTMMPPLEVVVNPAATVEDDLPLREENASAVERAVNVLPLWAWMALVAGLMLVGGYFFLPWRQWTGTASPTGTSRPGTPASLPTGPDWQTKKAEDVRGTARGRQLAVYAPAPTLRDFRLEMVASVQEQGIGWAFRVMNERNYHLLRLERAPVLTLTRFVVANGRETHHEKLTLPPALDATQPFTVALAARGHRFLAQVNNVVAGEWTDSRFPSGAVAVVSETGDRFIVRDVAVREGTARR